jgi:predicted enzyme related to lactoylglutathione lyase
MPISNVLAVLTVADMDSGRAWYERLMGRAADANPMESLAEWQVTETGWIQLVRDADRAGTAVLTLGVDDLEGHTAELAERDLTVGAITTGDFTIFASITDPEGNTITFAEDRGQWNL